VTGWIRDASDDCRHAYRGEPADQGAPALFDEPPLRPFRVAQERHGSVAAARCVPGYRYVPDRALSTMLEEGR